MSKVSSLKLDLAIRCGLSHNILDLIPLGVRELVATHVKRLKARLPFEDNEKWCDALFSVLEPVFFIIYCELLKRAESAISKRAHEAIAFFCGALCLVEDECVQTGGLGDDLAAKVE